jgi:hypothetical protein
MKKQFALFILMGLFLLTMVSAKPSVTTTFSQQGTIDIIAPSYDYHKQNKPFDFYWHVSNASRLLTNQTVNCAFHYYSKEDAGEHIYVDNNVKKFVNGRDFEVSLNAGNFTYNSAYCFLVECNTTTQTGARERCFEVNPTASILETSSSILLSILYGILLLFLIGGIYGLYRSEGAWQIAYICLAYVSLFCIFFLSWLISSNFLFTIPILTSIFWILWLVLAFGFLPFIAIISFYIIGRGIQDNLLKEYMSQGYSKEEAKGFLRKR